MRVPPVGAVWKSRPRIGGRRRGCQEHEAPFRRARSGAAPGRRRVVPPGGRSRVEGPRRTGVVYSFTPPCPGSSGDTLERAERKSPQSSRRARGLPVPGRPREGDLRGQGQAPLLAGPKLPQRGESRPPAGRADGGGG